MTKYYVETGMGCTLISAHSAEQARREALRKVGTYNGVQLVRKATKEDVVWAGAMRECRP